jgi:uncharacterized protein (DUF2141 family)
MVRHSLVLPLQIHWGSAWRTGVRGLTAACVAVFMHFDAVPFGHAKGNAAESYSITVDVVQLRNLQGRVAIGLFDTAEAFPNSKKSRRSALVRASQSPVRVTFSGLEPGAYAVAVLHDENQNDEMDFNILGMPVEGYGFSRDAPVLFGPPSFAAAAIQLESKSLRTVIKLRYFGF